MKTRWEKGKKLPYQECPNCGEYSYTTRRQIHKTAGRLVATVFFEKCSNCSLVQNKRVKIWEENLDLLFESDIGEWDRYTRLNGFEEYEIVLRRENVTTDKSRKGDSESN